MGSFTSPGSSQSMVARGLGFNGPAGGEIPGTPGLSMRIWGFIATPLSLGTLWSINGYAQGQSIILSELGVASTATLWVPPANMTIPPQGLILDEGQPIVIGCSAGSGVMEVLLDYVAPVS